MIDKKKIYAVITGDIVKSSKYRDEPYREKLISVLKESFNSTEKILPKVLYAPFYIFSGDSFQGVLTEPGLALNAAIIIRTALHFGFKLKQQRYPLDARIAVGIGKIDFLPDKPAEGDGDAFRLSGRNLNKIKGDQRLLVRTPWPEMV